MEKNVFGEELKVCCTSPMTGYFRDGNCRTISEDTGTHTVCAIMTEEFLNFSASRGNNLITPIPLYKFPGLKPGDKVSVEFKYKNGDIKKINMLCRIDTNNELEYYKHGGILQYVLRNMI